MKTKKLVLVVLFVIGFISASLSSVSGSAGNDSFTLHRKSADTTDSNGGGVPIPPIGH